MSSDSDSDDDIPIAKRRVATKKEESSSGDSSSDDDIPIGMKMQKKQVSSYNIDDSSSDDDMPLIPKLKSKNKQIRSNSNSNSVSSMSTSSSSPTSTPKKMTKKKSTKKNSNSRKRSNRFADSDSDYDDESSSSDDDDPIVPSLSAATIRTPARKKRKLSNGSPIRSPAASVRSNNSNRSKNDFSPRKRKKGSKTMPGYIGRECNPVHQYQTKNGVAELVADSHALKWWEDCDDSTVSYTAKNDSKNKIKWQTLDHNGIVFAPDYVPHCIPIKYDGKKIKLTPEQEEIATMFGVMIETDWAQKEKFRKNFMKEFQKILRDKKQKYQYAEIKDLDKCDFRDIYDWYQTKKENEKIKKKDPEYKKKLKQEKERYDSLYGWALVNGIREKVGNYKVEPPGLFRGRGEHPKMGMLKKRIMPENIILNIGENTLIPPCPISDHNWGGICHDKTVTYIAKWVENINGQHKFVYLSASSRFKGENDRNKYEKARLLKSKIAAIRADYESKLTSKSLMLKQLATAVWMIDILSIRVGNEKDTDEEADTVGVCSLRKEHITLLDAIPVATQNKNNNNDSDSDSDSDDDDVPINQIKSSSTKFIYKITLDFLGKDSMRYHNTVNVTKQIHKNLKIFLNGKNDDMDIFEKIDPNKVNDYLREQMEGLTAKVFRTHNASTTLQDELAKSHHEQIGAVTKDSPISEKIFFYNQCNKQVAILCNHQRSVSKTHAEQLEKMDKQIKDIKNTLKELKEELDIAQGKKVRSKKKKKNKDGLPEKKKKKKSIEQIKTQIKKKKEALQKKELAKAMKEDNKEVALGTSKINYMDPRITVSWCKKMKVPIEKIFNKSLLDKFPWAMQSKTKYLF